jgi:hypothetical protein
MRPQQAPASPSVGPGHELPRKMRAGKTNWRYLTLAAAGITLVSSVAGVLAYDWYYDTVLVGLSSSLQPIASAFHQLGGGHLRQASPQPAN